MLKLKKGFSFIEVIASLGMVLMLLFPSYEILTKQIFLLKKINTSTKNLEFINSVCTYLQNYEIFFDEDYKIIIKNYKELKENEVFRKFYLEYPIKDNFEISLFFKYQKINFYFLEKEANIIEINFLKENKNFKFKILNFKD